ASRPRAGCGGRCDRCGPRRSCGSPFAPGTIDRDTSHEAPAYGRARPASTDRRDRTLDARRITRAPPPAEERGSVAMGNLLPDTDCLAGPPRVASLHLIPRY